VLQALPVQFPSDINRELFLGNREFRAGNREIGPGSSASRRIRPYPDDSLARIPQYWIMTEAQKCGLRFKSAPDADPDSLINTKAARDKDGRLYDSRSGLGSYYRYGPRKLAELCDEKFSNKPGDKVLIRVPKIHESVFKRIQNNAHPCAPLGIPAKCEVVTDTGQFFP
jgi:hypothetical protein